MSVLYVDTACDLNHQELKKLDITTVVFPIKINGKENRYYIDDKFDYNDFYLNLKAGKCEFDLDKEMFVSAFKLYLDQNEDILYLGSSTKFYNYKPYLDEALKELKESYPERNITYYELPNISSETGALVYEAGVFHKRGATDKETIEFLNNLKKEECSLYILDKLEPIKKLRLLKNASSYGTMLNVKPLLMWDGLFEVLDKIQGRKRLMNALITKLTNDGMNVADYIIVISQANCENDAKYICETLEQKYGCRAIMQKMSPTNAIMFGENSLAVSFHCKKR